jgi:heptosyltransferase I
MRVLIVKLGSIGDIIHTLPALAALRDAMPHAEISWVVEQRSSEILRDNPILDRLIEVDTKALRRGLMSGETLRAPRQQLRRLRASAFDLAIDFQGLLKSASIARLSGARRVFGFSRDSLREPASRVLLSKAIPIPQKTHVIRKNLVLLHGALGIPVPQDASDFAFHSLITVGPGESDLAEKVLGSSRSGKARIARPSLKGFYELARRAKLYVGGDTGPTHIAVAAGTPIVGLFGPTEWWRNGSPRPEDICVDRLDIECRTECHRRSCSNWICMDIEVDRVFQAASQRLQMASALAPAYP